MKKLLIILLLFPFIVLSQIEGKFINNRPLGGTIDSVRYVTLLNFHQTSSGQTLTIPNLLTGSKIIYLRNVGTVDITFTVGGLVHVNDGVILGWTGTVWNVMGRGTISSTISGLTTNYLPKALTSTTIGNSPLYFTSSNLRIPFTSKILSQDSSVALSFPQRRAFKWSVYNPNYNEIFSVDSSGVKVLYNNTISGAQASLVIDSVQTMLTSTAKITLNSTNIYLPSGTANKLLYTDGSKIVQPITLGTNISLSGNVLNVASSTTTLTGDVTGSGTGTIATTLSGTFSSPNGLVLSQADSLSTNRGIKVTTRNVTGINYPVICTYPTTANKPAVFDIMPNGSPSPENPNGQAWLDVCNSDVLNTSTPALQTIRLAAHSSYLELGFFRYSTGLPLPIKFTQSGVNGVSPVAFFTFDPTALGTRMGWGLGSTSPTQTYHFHEATASQSCVIKLTNAGTGTTVTDGLDIYTANAGDAGIIQREAQPLSFWTNATQRVTIASTGGTYFGGSTTATAIVHLKAGTATASTAPLKFTAGVASQTTKEAGAVNYDGSNITLSDATYAYTLAKILRATATLDFGATAAGNSTDLTITVTGAVEGEIAFVGFENAASLINSCYTARCSTANTVSVRFNNYSGISQDPASGIFTVSVIKY